jgi:hypothetical protein
MNSTSLVSPVKLIKNVEVPTVNLEKCYERKVLSAMVKKYLWDKGKDCYIDPKTKMGSMLYYCCLGKREGCCPFFVKCMRKKKGKEEFWIITEVEYSHNNCIFSSAMPSLNLLKENDELISMSLSSKSLQDVVDHLQHTRQQEISLRQASRFRKFALAKVQSCIYLLVFICL